MASSSPSLCTLNYNAFTSFHRPDVGKTFISHLQKQFTSNRITMFDDEGVERGHTIDPALTQAIRESTISIVVLTKNYASSSWCLDGLLEILKCRQAGKLIVMPVFYGVRPNDVQRQTGDFGKGFEKTCRGKTILDKGRWSQALNKRIEYLIAREDTLNPTISSNKSRCSIDLVFLVVIINLLLEITSAVADQLSSSTRKPCFARISLVMSILSLILTIIDFTDKIRVHKVHFRCKLPIPWFYYPARDYSTRFGSSTDNILLFCVVGQLIVSTINFSFTERGRDGPIKVSVWPLVFAIGIVVSKFTEKPPISKNN
ncbi:hypothetical protein BRARA_C00824 [Brassica rapa]|uniref:TIR domain-containing protein n=1 Tax=Brassica campestris TaxID=3711 RepID=A0A397ZSV5_BRACM|nr:hypothetical protein BRARA_C00824 [Brassica rapa]